MSSNQDKVTRDGTQAKMPDTAVGSSDTVRIGPETRAGSKLEHTEKLLSEIGKRKQVRREGADTVPAKPSDKAQVLGKAGEIPREIPVRLGRYAIDGLIGRGGMGVVYKARQDGLDRVVALKLLLQGEHATTEGRQRFEREARAIAKLRHPNIVAVHEVGEYNGQPFFTMDFIDGVSLNKFVKRVPIESQKAIADLCARLADAVEYAHEQGVIHRDLKPENILMTATGEPIVTDFGLAKDLESMTMLSMSGEVMGTPGFMSPEQAQGRAKETDRRSDVYALGAILYWLLTKHEPFEGQSMVETLTRVATEDAPPATRINPAVSGDLCAVCLKAMDRDKRLRYPTAEEFADDLRRYLKGYPVQAEPWSWRRATRRFVVRHKWAVAAAAAAVAAILVVGVLSATWFARTYLEIAAKRMRSPDPVIRAQALKDLGREALRPEELKVVDVPRALALLVAMGSDADAGVATAWLEFLAEHGDDAGVAAAVGPETALQLIQIADSADKPGQRNLAIAAIGKIRRPDFARYLMARLTEPNPSVRMLVVRSLGDQRAIEALGPLINLQTSDPICRAEARAALTKMYTEGRVAAFGAQDRAVKGGLRTATEAMTKYSSQIEDMLDEMDGRTTKPGPFSACEQALASDDAAIRIKAVYELGMTGDKTAAPLLVAALEDKDPGVGAAAAMAMSQVDPEGQVEAMRESLSASSPSRRGNAALALGFMKSRTALDALLVALAGENDLGAKQRMIQGLGEMGLNAAIPGLHEAARSDPRVKPDVDAAVARLR